jgi:hypothetical protein
VTTLSFAAFHGFVASHTESGLKRTSAAWCGDERTWLK